jgi:hypothetical protein
MYLLEIGRLILKIRKDTTTHWEQDNMFPKSQLMMWPIFVFTCACRMVSRLEPQTKLNSLACEEALISKVLMEELAQNQLGEISFQLTYASVTHGVCTSTTIIPINWGDGVTSLTANCLFSDTPRFLWGNGIV